MQSVECSSQSVYLISCCPHADQILPKLPAPYNGLLTDTVETYLTGRKKQPIPKKMSAE